MSERNLGDSVVTTSVPKIPVRMCQAVQDSKKRKPAQVELEKTRGVAKLSSSFVFGGTRRIEVHRPSFSSTHSRLLRRGECGRYPVVRVEITHTTANIFTVVTVEDPSRGHLTQFLLVRILPSFSHPFSPSSPTQSYLKLKQAAENSQMSVVLAIVTTFHWSGIGRLLGRDDIGKAALRRISGVRSLGSKSLYSGSQPNTHQSAIRSKAHESTCILQKGSNPPRSRHEVAGSPASISEGPRMWLTAIAAWRPSGERAGAARNSVSQN